MLWGCMDMFVLTWGIVVKHGITHADLQDERTQQLLHVGQQGLRTGEETAVTGVQQILGPGAASRTPLQRQVLGAVRKD